MKYTLLLLLCVFALPGWCVFPLEDVTAGEFLGASDIVIVGTVTAVAAAPAPLPAIANQATIKVERRVKGLAPGTVAARFGGADGPVFRKGERALYGLRRGPGGYALVGALPVEQADRMAALAAEYPVSLTIEPPAGPFYFMLMQTLTVRVRNNTAYPLTVGFYTTDSYYYTMSMYGDTGMPPLDTIAPVQAAGGGPEYPESDPILPGKDGLVTLLAMPFRSNAWNALPRDQYLHTLIALRARLTLTMQAAENNVARPVVWRGIATPWITTTLGYAPPGDQNFRFPVAR